MLESKPTTWLMLGGLGAIGSAAVIATACSLAALPLVLLGLTGVAFAHRRQGRELTEMRERLSAALAEVAQARTARTKFLSAAGHDLRQPLHALGLLMAVMRRRNRSAQARELVARMEDSLHAAEGLLESLLDVSRLEAGLVHPDPAPMALDAVTARVAERLGDEAAAKGLRLTIRRQGLTGISDPALFERILTALVSNAIRFTEAGGVLVGCRRRGATLRVEVWDTGIGIDDQHRPHVFEEFYQAANQARDRRHGLGLGLSVAARLAGLLGHRL
ncbi:MAG: HAMP domain-containing histidine kinase, partial [Alphaproteobacteria bacterium]|nr:HAMP domain-containing histidine kinase [Alphaproteobacteria bacterium]